MGDLRVIPNKRAGLGEGFAEGTVNDDVRDPHQSVKAKPCGPIPTNNHNGCIKFEMAYACSAEKPFRCA